MVDFTDDRVYVYSLAAATFQSSFALASANTTPTGIASDGSSLYVVDSLRRQAGVCVLAGRRFTIVLCRMAYR